MTENRLDIMVVDHGTIWTFEPLTEAGQEFVDRHVQTEDWQWIGPRFGVEHRAAPLLVEAMQAHGLEVGI